MKHSALKQILDNAVKAEDVQDIFKMAGLERYKEGRYPIAHSMRRP